MIIRALAILLGSTFCAVAWADAGPAPASPNPLRALDKASLSAFVEQPLFDPARRLPPPVPFVAPLPQQVTAPTVEPPALRLLGVIHGARDVAIIHRADSAKAEMLTTGDSVGPWRVTVLPVGVRLTDGDRAYDYALFAKGGAAIGPVPAPTPPHPRNPRTVGEAR